MKIRDLQEEKLNPGTELYLTPGRNVQLIGSQNGAFAPFGHHVENEMGGIWMQPIKLLDGFWLGFRDKAGKINWLTNAVRYENHVFYNVLIFETAEFTIKRTEFSASTHAGLIVKFELSNKTAHELILDSVLSVVTDLRPVWYSQAAQIFDGADTAWIEQTDFCAKDDANNWFTRCRLAGLPSTKLNLSETVLAGDETFGTGTCGFWNFTLQLKAGEQQCFSLQVTGSLKSDEETLERMNLLKDEAKVFEEKAALYQEILDTAALEIPDKALEKQFAWSKCHIEWLTIDSEAVGMGLTAGIPEYIWWFGVDSVYALKGCLPAGFHKLAEQTLGIISEGSERANGNGRIIHEENTYGVVGNRGNTQETALFIHGLYETFRWTGHIDWLCDYYPIVKKALHYLLVEMDADGDLFPEGFGVIEGRGLTGEVIDTAVYTAVALENASEMAFLFNEAAQAQIYHEKSQALAEKIRTEMWLSAENLFADVRASGKDLAEIFEELIKRSFLNHHQEMIDYYTQVKAEFEATGLDKTLTDMPYNFKNWVIDTPLEMKIATFTEAEAALKRLNSSEFIGEYGAYLSGDGDKRMMTISSAVLINSNLAYGRADEAYELMKRIMKTYSLYLPGSISEMSPDYGCFVQAWTAYAMIAPLLTGFLGLQPNAVKKELLLTPCLPTAWDELTVKNVKIGVETFDFHVERQKNNRYFLSIAGNLTDWKIKTAENVVLR